jgi:hypothetical protein
LGNVPNALWLAIGTAVLMLAASVAACWCGQWLAVWRRRLRDRRRRDALRDAEDGAVFTLNLVYNRSHLNTPLPSLRELDPDGTQPDASDPVAVVAGAALPLSEATPTRTFTVLGASPQRQPLLEW